MAVINSFREAGMGIVDHHTLMDNVSQHPSTRCTVFNYVT